VKANLDKLTRKSPDAALAAKRHLGAPMGLDFTALDARAKEAEAWATKALAHYEAHRDQLLGLKPKKAS